MNDFHIYPWAFVVKHMWEAKRKNTNDLDSNLETTLHTRTEHLCSTIKLQH